MPRAHRMAQALEGHLEAGSWCPWLSGSEHPSHGGLPRSGGLHRDNYFWWEKLKKSLIRKQKEGEMRRAETAAEEFVT